MNNDSTIEQILAYIGITHDNVRQDAYNHWKRFIEFIRQRTPAEWKHNIRPKLRSYIGVDFRYIDDYYECCLSWGIMKSNNGIVNFVGIPKNVSIPEKTKKFTCAYCEKDITEQVNSEQFFQKHGLKFCNKTCSDQYSKREGK